jgi:hypothetical protein
MPYKNKADEYAAQKRHRVKIRERLLEFLSKRRCVDCGENNPVVLEFDHVDPKTKSRGVARMLAGHWSWEAVSIEIEKCEIRCANCHRKKTYSQYNFWGRTKPL